MSRYKAAVKLICFKKQDVVLKSFDPTRLMMSNLKLVFCQCQHELEGSLFLT